jgi:hypothetical protein
LSLLLPLLLPIRPEASSVPAWFRLAAEWRAWSLPASSQPADFAVQSQQARRAAVRL